MKAVVAEMPPHWFREHKDSEKSQWDEVWEGVLHVPPMPNLFHQDFAGQLYSYLRTHWAKPNKARVYNPVNVSPADEPDWTMNFRIPDLVLLSPAEFKIEKSTHLAGAPLVVIEIRSPGDESYEKLPFYAGLGVPEVWIFDRDTKALDLRRLGSDGSYTVVRADAEGWLRSPATGVSFRPAEPDKIRLRTNDDPATDEELPDN